MRFNREARKLLQDPANSEITLRDYLHAHQFGGEFTRYYLHPMAAAVWSTSPEEIEDFPVFTLIRFLENHGLLGLSTAPQWYVLQGGSSAYIPPLTAPYRERIRLGAKIEGVTRTPAGGEFISKTIRRSIRRSRIRLSRAANAATATGHNPGRAAGAERFPYQPQRDGAAHRLKPAAAAAGGACIVELSSRTRRRAATLTYHMNRLQSLPTPEDYCVTLNNVQSVDERRILREMTYFHPLYTLEAVRAQARWPEISGHNRTHFCGAYCSTASMKTG